MPAKNQKMSAEQKAKISAALKGRPRAPRGPMSSDTKAKIKAGFTPESRAKISASHRGRPKSVENREKISASLKANSAHMKAASVQMRAWNLSLRKAVLSS